MRTPIAITLCLLNFNVLSTQSNSIEHSHNNRTHAHPLPSSGMNHNHNQQQTKQKNKEEIENQNTSPFSFKVKKTDKIVSVKKKLDAVKITLLGKVGNEKYPYTCTNSKRFDVGCVTYDDKRNLLFEVRYTQKPKPSANLDNYDYDNKTMTSTITGYQSRYNRYKNKVITYEKLEEGSINHKQFINVRYYGLSDIELSTLQRAEKKLISLAKSLYKSNYALYMKDGECYLSKNQNNIICTSVISDTKNRSDENRSILVVKSYMSNPETNPDDIKFKYDSNSKAWSLRTVYTDRITIHKAMSQVTKDTKKISHIEKSNFR